MRRLVLLSVGVVAVLLSGVVHGLRTERWGPTIATSAAVERLPALPLTLGEWRGQPIDMNPARFREAGCAGYLTRRYIRDRDGREVALLLLCGQPGSIAVHTPDLCYPMQGYELLGAPRSAAVGAAEGQFRVADFGPPRADTQPGLRIFWSWNAGAAWKVPTNPRLTFALAPILYKLYVIRPLTSAAEPTADDPAVDFLRVLLPEVEKIVRQEPGEANNR